MTLRTGSRVKFTPKTNRIGQMQELVGKTGTATGFDVQKGYIMVDFGTVTIPVYYDEVEVVEA